LIEHEDFLIKLKTSAENLKKSYPRPLTTRQFSLYYLAKVAGDYLDFLPRLKEEQKARLNDMKKDF
jgi:hypothetical protein